MNAQTKGLFPPYNAPPHEPRHPLQDGLYWLLTDYRVAKPFSRIKAAVKRQAALQVIRQIKGRGQ